MTNIVIFIIIKKIMKITFKGDYALKAILDLSYRYGGNKAVSIATISKRQNIPAQYLEQIMLILKGAGFIDSKRGIGGGFFLKKPPEQIILGDVVRQVEGPIEPIACGKKIHDYSCGEENECVFREIWLNVTNAISEIVDHVTFADIMRMDMEMKSRKGYMYDI
jgi:Rrf2 family transcriptional regulator, cysteine metabolism repressor